MSLPILTLNAGSSSLKFAVYRINDVSEDRLFSGAAEEVGGQGGKFWLRGAGGDRLDNRKTQFADHREAADAMFAALAGHGTDEFLAVGHRLVHGGPVFSGPQRVDGHSVAQLKQMVPLAPLHLPDQIAMIEEIATRFPKLP